MELTIEAAISFDLWRARLWHFRQGGLSQVREHNRRIRSKGRVPASWKKRAAIGSFTAWDIPDQKQWHGRRDLRVGIIADHFTALSLSFEWDQVPLTKDWRKQIEAKPLDLLFVESAWHGNDDVWRSQLSGRSAPSSELRELVKECKNRGIPTAFWNKEDPIHFDDFLRTAELFDHIFTTDTECVLRYRTGLGHDRVTVLPFAAQPAIHNPIPSYAKEDLRDVAFAGTYYRDKFPERRAQMDILLGGALDAQGWLKTGLDIYSRFSNLSSAYAFPPEYSQHVRGELSYEQMLSASRAYKVFLNVNSIVGSPSMCARRVFEITACGTPVLSTESPALDAFFPPEELIRVKTREEAKQWIRALDMSPELRDRVSHLASRRIWKHHTYAHRVDTVLDACGIEHTPHRLPTVTAMVSTCRPHQVNHVLEQLAQQVDVDLEPVILTHGFSPDDQMRGYARELGLDVQWIEGEPELKLGECYNQIVAQSSGETIAKIDDDDLYAPNYLFDQLAAMNYSNADVVGKGAYYMWLEHSSILCLRFEHLEHQFCSFVSGPTIVARRDICEENPFIPENRGEDSSFLKAVTSGGGKLFSASRFGFIQTRNSSANHTWDVQNSEILGPSQVVAFTKDVNRVLI